MALALATPTRPRIRRPEPRHIRVRFTDRLRWSEDGLSIIEVSTGRVFPPRADLLPRY